MTILVDLITKPYRLHAIVSNQFKPIYILIRKRASITGESVRSHQPTEDAEYDSSTATI